MSSRWLVAMLAVVSVSVPRLAAADEVTLASCLQLDAGGAFDFLNRAFYVRSYPAANLGRVTLRLQPGTANAEYTFTLTAHDSTYDGTVIGVATVDIPNMGGPVAAAFDFHGAPTTPGHVIAFVIQGAGDGGPALMDNGNDNTTPCVPIQETNGSTPPLDGDRFGTMGADLTTYGPGISAVSPAMGSPAGGSGVSIAASFVAPGASVTFGGVPATPLTFLDGGVGEAGTFTAVTPAHAAGEVDVVITMTYANDAGIDASASATLQNGYFYGSDVIDGGSEGGGGGGFDASTSRADSGADNGAAATDNSGCGCDLPGADGSAISFAPALLAFGALLRFRRRR